MLELIERLERLRKTKRRSNELDVLVEVAIFKPDAIYASARANAAGTKVIYVRHDDVQETHWAPEHTGDIEASIAILSAKGEGG